ncbi:Beta-galactosidase 3 [Morella rubra]|uniref:Beta-galactosidase 3 n=1 Tax=Morella rubra TaxID=262757 RepID=A0A6A1WT00_9ROSI|nr:Beta-galactosidase 3 [Morella rubra]
MKNLFRNVITGANLCRTSASLDVENLPKDGPMHVPRSWFKPSGNILLIFEEKGGDPTKISFSSLWEKRGSEVSSMDQVISDAQELLELIGISRGVHLDLSNGVPPPFVASSLYRGSCLS